MRLFVYFVALVAIGCARKPWIESPITQLDASLDRTQARAQLASLSERLPSELRAAYETLLNGEALSDPLILREHRDPQLVTGYFEIELSGSRTRTARYQFPVYRRPSDLVQISLQDFDPQLPAKKLFGKVERTSIVPYPDRSQLSSAASPLSDDQALAFVDDEVRLAFLHIQGSGVIRFEDGSTMNVGYAAPNGRPYRPIGKALLERELVKREELSMQKIIEVLEARPELRTEILNYNPSYIFFEERSASATGSLGVPLIGFAAIAVDPTVYPLGRLGILETSLPVKHSAPRPARFLVWTLDVGGAIKGPGRVDLFTGRGEDAEFLAGHLKASGRLQIIEPKGGE